ncbi:hypothetical protein GQ457_11G026700 [Hibiscus cannabinus]
MLTPSSGSTSPPLEIVVGGSERRCPSKSEGEPLLLLSFLFYGFEFDLFLSIFDMLFFSLSLSFGFQIGSPLPCCCRLRFYGGRPIWPLNAPDMVGYGRGLVVRFRVFYCLGYIRFDLGILGIWFNLAEGGLARS